MSVAQQSQSHSLVGSHSLEFPCHLQQWAVLWLHPGNVHDQNLHRVQNCRRQNTAWKMLTLLLFLGMNTCRRAGVMYSCFPWLKRCLHIHRIFCKDKQDLQSGAREKFFAFTVRSLSLSFYQQHLLRLKIKSINKKYFRFAASQQTRACAFGPIAPVLLESIDQGTPAPGLYPETLLLTALPLNFHTHHSQFSLLDPSVNQEPAHDSKLFDRWSTA